MKSLYVSDRDTAAWSTCVPGTYASIQSRRHAAAAVPLAKAMRMSASSPIVPLALPAFAALAAATKADEDAEKHG